MKQLPDWYSPIRKVPLEYMGVKSNAWSVQIEHLTDKSEWQELGVVSDNYLLIDNTKVEELINDIAAASSYQWEKDKIFWNGKQFMYSMVSRDASKNHSVDVNDDLGLGMMIWNSYDGSTALQFKLYIQRLACLNGMISNDVFKSFRFKHDKNSANYEDEIMEAVKLIQGSDDKIRYVTKALRYMLHEPLDIDKLSLIRNDFLNKLPVSLFGNIVDKLLDYKPMEVLTTYDLLNAGTNVTWHKDKHTKSDFDHNAYIVDNLINYANKKYGVS